MKRMKRMNNKIRYILLLCAACSLAACKDQLNVFPTTSEVDGNVIVDAKSASTVLNGVYYRFANAGEDYNKIPSVKWTDVNEISPSEMCNLVNNSSGNDGFYTLSLTAGSSGTDFMWNYGYAIVNAANGFLKNIETAAKIPAATKRQMKAEARFLRAFGNAELLLYYGQYYDPNSKYGIILRDEFVTSHNISLPRSTVSDSYAAILGDLDSAIAGLPDLNSQIFYANASAAKLLKARVLINRGASGDYAQVINLTDDIIKNGPFKLEDNLKDLFLVKGLSSSEVILGVQPYSTENYKFQQNQYYGQYPASDALVSLLENDPRSQWVYKSDQGGTLYGSFAPLNEITKYYSGNVLGAVKTALSENCYAFRLTEAYLLEAEAITLSGGSLSTAKDLLKTVLAHAGVTDFSSVDQASTPDNLHLLIVKEFLRNFVAENGIDWFALRRLPMAEAQIIQPALKNVNQLILPIPNSEITTNGSVIQNP